MSKRTIATILAGLAFSGGQVQAQAFGAGPPGTPKGTSYSGVRIDGAPARPSESRIPNVDVFGDEAAERAYGKDYDDSYLKPRIVQPGRGARSSEERAVEGRSELGTVNSGSFARQGPRAIGQSPVTRGSHSRNGRARIVMPGK